MLLINSSARFYKQQLLRSSVGWTYRVQFILNPKHPGNTSNTHKKRHKNWCFRLGGVQTLNRFTRIAEEL